MPGLASDELSPSPFIPDHFRLLDEPAGIGELASCRGSEAGSFSGEHAASSEHAPAQGPPRAPLPATLQEPAQRLRHSLVTRSLSPGEINGDLSLSSLALNIEGAECEHQPGNGLLGDWDAVLSPDRAPAQTTLTNREDEAGLPAAAAGDAAELARSEQCAPEIGGAERSVRVALPLLAEEQVRSEAKILEVFVNRWMC